MSALLVILRPPLSSGAGEPKSEYSAPGGPMPVRRRSCAGPVAQSAAEPDLWGFLPSV